MNRHLASRFTVGLALATLVGTSAFADDRPSNETRRGGNTVRRERAADRSQVRRGDNSSNRRREERQLDRNRTDSRPGGRDSSARDRSRDSRPSGRDSSARDRSRDSRPSGRDWSARDRSRDSRSDNNRSYNNRSNNNRSFGDRSRNRQPYFARGRVSRISPHRGGFRVWIGGAPYPFFVPSAYYYGNRFRVGLDIRLGGYYNPLGYYDYYSGYNDNRGYSSAELRGVVESVDFRRDTFVVRNDATGSFVTVEMRDRRRDVRPGDYVELEGEWTRSGLFRAYDVNRIDDEYRR